MHFWVFMLHQLCLKRKNHFLIKDGSGKSSLLTCYCASNFMYGYGPFYTVFHRGSLSKHAESL
ncbi:hypothetical protein ES288_D10G180500v1 [Gossypium darwinii]|uniref:Uncharacterized protein n=1 Tax=Gossypium darwinii TaxID=34276 RepID=A0A5D2AZQ1_GOSDA|nr:hypothetical protein ES288_D10G180500v1 [Gossypium darwinii]